MERGVYFDGWSPQTYCQHPSMPPRRLSMIDDLEAMRATVLVWAGLGGGSISLPYLEEEAHGPIPARFRQYGYVNESEFIAHARERGVDLFAIVFESQAWEFAAEVAEGEVLAQCELRGAAPQTTVGLREFSTNTGPASWRPFEHYFPNGLVNSAGEQVRDLWEEVACRDLDGAPIHAHWVEVDAREQASYYADRNNPVWREYLKAIIRIQIDAGATAIQLDETDTPMSALRYGGCFCKDCIRLFGEYLAGLPAAQLPEELHDVSLEGFDYADWLRAQGFQARCNPRTLPLYRTWVRWLQLAIRDTFREITGFARQYAAELGHEIRISGNFYDLAPYWDAMVDEVDMLVTEMRETRFQQPWYFRHGVGLSRGRPLIAVENPYGGVVPRLVEGLNQGRAWDLFRLTIFEASAMGANMSLPYGSWLGTEVKDSYSAPFPLLAETGRFLEEIDHLIAAGSPHRTAVVFSSASLVDAAIDSDQFSDGERWFPHAQAPEQHPASYWECIEELSRSGRTFDCLVFSDPELRPDGWSEDVLDGYETVVLPDVWSISLSQHRAVLRHLERGGHVVVLGTYGETLDTAGRAAVLDHEHTSISSVESIGSVAGGDAVRCDLGRAAAVSVQSTASGVAVHLINYDYDEEADRVTPRAEVRVAVTVDGPFRRTARLHRPGLPVTELKVAPDGAGAWDFVVPSLGTYAVIELEDA